MVPLIIFYLHIVGFSSAFVSEYQKDGISGGFLTLGFMILIFSVGWTISSFILRHLIDAEGINIWLNRDSISLLALSCAEFIFYFYYFYGKGKNPQHLSQT